MALTVEDGSVVTGADAYEDAATTAARLAALNLSSFDGKTEAEQEKIIRRRTIECEEQLRAGVEGTETSDGQPRLFPRLRCYDTQMRLFDSDDIPEALKAAVAHRCEDDAAGRVSTGRRDVKSHSSARGKIEYTGNGAGVFASQSPEAQQHLRRLFWNL